MAELQQKQIADAGFRSRAGGNYRPDATAWAILALEASNDETGDMQSTRARLAADQQPDGRVSIDSEHPEAFWPTSLAVLAWNRAPEFREAQIKAIQFLLHTTGYHFHRESDAPFSHDSSVKGWPWIANTHSWVMPTSLAIIALKVAGLGDHERVQEAKRLLLDRQLPDGGWNYGNTKVFGQELHPMPETTGVALSALSGSVSREEITVSLKYLKIRVTQVRTPMSLSWGLLGLGAWGEEPAETATWLANCWQRQERYGTYDTEAISLMLIALSGPQGIFSLFSRPAV